MYYWFLKLVFILCIIGVAANLFPFAVIIFIIYKTYQCFKMKRLPSIINKYSTPTAKNIAANANICQKYVQEEEELEEIEIDLDYDDLDGHKFEYLCADVLRKNDFYDVTVTQACGDFGVDIIAFKDNQKYVIQCKRFSSNVGNRAVQEIYSGKAVYDADVAVVMTNRYFTQSAIETAKKTNVLLWDRDTLNQFIRNMPIPQTHKTQEETIYDEKYSYMYDKQHGIFPPGTYLVGEDIPIGTYILESRGNLTGYISIYESYGNYKKSDMISYNSFIGDYHLSLREKGIFIDVQNADIERL